MLKTKQVCEILPAKLVRAVVRQLGGTEKMKDIANHGIDGGFGGFIYYTETFEFYKKNRTEINTLAESMAEEYGIDPVSFVAGINCLRPADNLTKRAIMRCLGGGRLPTNDDNIDTVANALAWFAGEEVARGFCND